MASKEPKNLDEMKADPKMLAAALVHAKKAHVDENILFYFDKGNAQGLYPKYFDQKGAKALNLDSDILERAKKMADANDWGNGKWTALIAEAKAAVATLYWTDAFPRFKASPEYKALVTESPAPKKAPDAAKAARLLGITDVEALKKALAAKDDAARTKALDALAKEENKKQKGKDLLAALEKAGLI